MDQRIDNDGFQRDSNGTEFVVGTTFDASGTIFGEAYIGTRETEYDDPRFLTADGPTFGLDLTWNPSGLTTVELSASREIDSTTVTGVSGDRSEPLRGSD